MRSTVVQIVCNYPAVCLLKNIALVLCCIQYLGDENTVLQLLRIHKKSAGAKLQASKAYFFWN
jgi:hypothetical protein